MIEIGDAYVKITGMWVKISLSNYVGIYIGAVGFVNVEVDTMNEQVLGNCWIKL